MSDEKGVSGPRRLRVAVAGLGVIGEGVALRLVDPSEPYVLCAALVNDAGKQRNEKLAGLRTYTDPHVLLVEHPDVVVDALPSAAAGKSLIETALASGVNVVTANKQAIAGSMAPLHKLAAQHKTIFAYSASVGGGSPMIETARKARASGNARAVTGILNGTVNYILSAMKEGAGFDDAVTKAQKAGFAEPDPTADLSGEDARAKIAILSYEVFGREIDPRAIKVEPLDGRRAQGFVDDGGVWKQLAVITRNTDGGITARVGFDRVSDDPFFCAVTGEGNALRIVNDDGRVFTCDGKGAGRAPTVDSIFSDLEVISAAPRSEDNPDNRENALRLTRTLS